MRDLLLGEPVCCELSGKRTYDRLVGVCYIEGNDIGVAVIEAGLALDCQCYSGGQYKVIETVEGREVAKLLGCCMK